MIINVQLSESESRLIINALHHMTQHSDEYLFIQQKVRHARLRALQHAIENYVHTQPCKYCDDSGYEDWAGYCMVQCRKGCK
jgi:hypothetical protein